MIPHQAITVNGERVKDKSVMKASVQLPSDSPLHLPAWRQLELGRTPFSVAELVEYVAAKRLVPGEGIED